MYAKLLAGLDGIRDRAIFVIARFCALRPSELLGLTWGCYAGNVLTIVNRVAWPAAEQENQAQEPLRTHQLPPCRDPPSRAQGD